MVSSNLGFFLALLFQLSYVKDATSVGAGNNVTVKMARCRDNERRALLDFKEGLVQYGEFVSSWGKGKEEDCCHWRGIRCSKRTGHVTVLSIPGYYFKDNYVRGKVSPSLLELSHLKYLDLSGNFFDSIPDFLGSLTRLQYLNLSHSLYSAKVPHQLGNLTNLRHLDLGFNSGTTVDNLDWLSQLHFLRYLDLSEIDLSKSSDWLQQIFKLPFLMELHLSMCQLPVPLLPITNSSSSLIPLAVVDLSYNHFTHPSTYNWLFNFSSSLVQIDLAGNDLRYLDWLSHLHFLRYLDLSGIDLSQSSDWLQQISKLPSLTELHLSGCHLTLPEYPLLPITNSSSSLIPLAVVDLSHNHFTHPSTYNWLFNFSSSLVQIDLSFSDLNGSIPEAFGTMVSLENLYLNDNNFNGSIPEAFGSMVSLENLNLNSNNFIGHLPESFWNLSHLDTLDLGSNNFDGKLNEFLIPLAANQKNSLRVLRLGENQLCGSLPDFTSFPHLREISISSNQITGILPNLTLFSSLEVLLLKNNQLEDTISEAYFSNLTKLYYLDLSSNRLTLKFSFEWVPPFQLHHISLRNCNLGPHFPNWLQSQHNIFVLDISCAGIFDTIPLWFWDHSSGIEILNISNNHIQGMLPHDLSHKFDYLWVIDVSSNNLKGLIPSFGHDVWVLHLSRNMFTGSLSFLCKNAHTSLSFLDLSDNQLSGELPDCWMNLSQIHSINLANNNLSGKLPTSIGLLNPVILQLRNNSLRGELPASLKNYNKVRLLDLSKNKLSGEVPTWIGTHLTSLVVFSVRKNKFSGSIPPQVCHLRNAQVLDFSQNNISGSIPLCFNNLTSLITRKISILGSGSFYYGLKSDIYHAEFITSAFLQWKGVELEYTRTLGLLKLIDLSSNKLVGRIPNEFSYLEGLISLNLSRNKFSGNVIQNIGQMKMLEILDLSQNQLTGEIPSGLASLTFLDVLDLSNNNLLGKIPSSTQLQSFDASAYFGNDKLCGPPLSVCPGEEPKISLPTPVGHSCGEHNKVGLYVSVVCGFATGFWGFLCPIFLRRSWRHAYFSMLQKIYDWMYLTAAVNMARLRRKIKG